METYTPTGCAVCTHPQLARGTIATEYEYVLTAGLGVLALYKETGDALPNQDQDSNIPQALLRPTMMTCSIFCLLGHVKNQKAKKCALI